MAVKTPSQIIPMEPSDYFTNEDWSALTGTLRKIESHFRHKANELGLAIQASSRWPTLSLVKRRAFKRRSVTLRLASDYVLDDKITWELATEEITHAWIFFYRLNEHRTNGIFSDGEDCQMLMDSIDQVVEQYLVAWSGN